MNYTPFFYDPKFIEVFSAIPGKECTTGEISNFMHNWYTENSIEEGLEYSPTINGEKKPAAYEIYLPEGEINAVVMSVYGGYDNTHYDKILSRCSGNNDPEGVYYASKGIAYIKLLTHEFQFTKSQDERTEEEINEVLFSIYQFKQELPRICPQIADLPIYLQGASFGAVTTYKYANKYNDFDGYVLEYGPLKLNSYKNLELSTLHDIEKPILIAGNILDNNVSVKLGIKPYITQKLYNQSVYSILEKYWNIKESKNYCKKHDKLYPEQMILGGHNISDEMKNSIIKFILDQKPNKNLGIAQAWYAILSYDNQNSIAKYFDIYKNNSTTSLKVDWNSEYKAGCRVQYLIDSLKSDEDMQAFVGAIKDKVTDEMLIVVMKEYLKDFIPYNKMAYEGEFVTEEEINIEAEALSNPENIFFKAFKNFFENIDTAILGEYFSVHNRDHIDHVVGVLLKNFLDLIELSSQQEQEFAQYEKDKKKEFEQEIRRYINALNDYGWTVLCIYDKKAYVLRHWQLSAVVIGTVGGVALSGALISIALVCEFSRNSGNINIYFSPLIRDAMNNLIAQDNSQLFALRSNEFAIAMCAAAITIAAAVVAISIAGGIVYNIKHSYDSKIQDYVNHTFRQGLPAEFELEL